MPRLVMRFLRSTLPLAVVLAGCSSESQDQPPATDGAVAGDGATVGGDAAASCQDSPRKTLASISYKHFTYTSYEDPQGWSAALSGSSVGLAYVEASDSTSCFVNFVVLGLDSGKTLGKLKLNARPHHYNWNNHNYVSVASSPSGFGLAWDSWRADSQLETPGQTYYTDLYAAFTDAKGALVQQPVKQNKSVAQYSDPRYEVRAWFPRMRWLTNRYCLTWHDWRLNSPKPSGQQYSRHGIYATLHDASGQRTSSSQVTQSNFVPGSPKALAGDTSHAVVLWGYKALWMATRKEPSKFDVNNHIKLLDNGEKLRDLVVEDDEAGHFLALVRTDKRLLMLPFTTSGPGTPVDLDPSGSDLHLLWDAPGKRFVALYRRQQGTSEEIRIATFDSDGALIGSRAVADPGRGWIGALAPEGSDRLRVIWIDRAMGTAKIEQQQLCLPPNS